MKPLLVRHRARRYAVAVTSTSELIQDFLSGDVYAVAGASSNRSKYGNKVLRCYQEHGRSVYAVHPFEKEVEGAPAVPNVAALPEAVHGLSIVTPPSVTERIVDEAHAAGITRVWMQPGAESALAIERAKEHGMSVIAGGPCVLVSLGFRGP
jgi:predicted CoA-binding protein